MSADATITWIRVEKPVFDLPGVILSSLGLAGVCVVVSLLCGSLLGCFLIRRAGRRRREPGAALTLRVSAT